MAWPPYGWWLATGVVGRPQIRLSLLQLPHYHAEEASKHLRPMLGKYYLRDNRHIARALWEVGSAAALLSLEVRRFADRGCLFLQDIRDCHYVAPDTKGSGVLWFRS